jgi:hypothetical protein
VIKQYKKCNQTLGKIEVSIILFHSVWPHRVFCCGKHCDRAMLEMNADIYVYSFVMLKYIFPPHCNAIVPNEIMIMIGGAKQHTSCMNVNKRCEFEFQIYQRMNLRQSILSFREINIKVNGFRITAVYASLMPQEMSWF